MKEKVYCVSDQAALAILIDCPVTEKMELTCSGTKAIDSLQKTLDQIGLVRIVSGESGVYTYSGVWMVTSIDRLSASQASVRMIDMTTVISWR